MTRTTADEWYDDWLNRVTRRSRRPTFLKSLEGERRAVATETALAGTHAYDAATRTAREIMRRHNDTHLPVP